MPGRALVLDSGRRAIGAAGLRQVLRNNGCLCCGGHCETLPDCIANPISRINVTLAGLTRNEERFQACVIWTSPLPPEECPNTSARWELGPGTLSASLQARFIAAINQNRDCLYCGRGDATLMMRWYLANTQPPFQPCYQPIATMFPWLAVQVILDERGPGGPIDIDARAFFVTQGQGGPGGEEYEDCPTSRMRCVLASAFLGVQEGTDRLPCSRLKAGVLLENLLSAPDPSYYHGGSCYLQAD